MTYHGVHIPSKTEAELNNEEPNVFTELDEALKVLKTHKDARLKSFKNSKDAVKFAQGGDEICPIKASGLKSPSASTPTPPSTEKTFRAPTKQELIQFRKAIEEDNYESIEVIIWANPRYLVSFGDTPTSLKDGTRYNALHVCAIHKRARIADLILQTISKTNFVELLHGKKNPKICQEVCEILLDYFLNMPEKGRDETPLHLAVKLGSVEVVEVLTSYPQCKMTPNRENLMPRDMICSRVNDASKELIARITNLLGERFYVPVIRSVDNTTPPVIGEPFLSTNPPELNRDPLSPEMEIQAFAGPMKKEQAQSFRRRWKTPPRVTASNSYIAHSPYISPLKFKSNAQGLLNNNTSPKSSLFPNKSLNLDYEDTANGNNSNSPSKEIDNNNDEPEKFVAIVSTPILKRRKELFFTYRDRIASPAIFNDIDSPAPPCNDLFDSPSQKERHLKLSDTEKGLEMIGRELAREQHVAWKEYWDFLGCFVDITSPEGLNLLEAHLKKRKDKEEAHKTRKIQKAKEETLMDNLCNALNNLEMNRNNINNQINARNSIAMKANCNNQSTAPYLCVEKSLQVFAKRITKTIILNLESLLSISDAYNSELERLKSLVCSFKVDPRFLEIDFSLVHSRFATLILAYLKGSGDIDNSAIQKIQECCEQIVQTKSHLTMEKDHRTNCDKKEHLLCVSMFILEYSKFMENKILPENLKTEQICLQVWQKERSCNCRWESSLNRQVIRKKRLEVAEAFKKAFGMAESTSQDVKSGKILENESWQNPEFLDIEEDEDVFWSDIESDEEELYYTPPESPSMLELEEEEEVLTESYKIYLLGDEPTKRDLDVINALTNTEINKDIYPIIHRWRTAILRHPLDERDNFPSPTVIVKRRVESYHNSDRLTYARRLFSSSPLKSSSTPYKCTSPFNHYRHPQSISSGSSLNDSPLLTKGNLSLSLMDVSDV